jgi:DNA-binding NtrC family response regulator
MSSPGGSIEPEHLSADLSAPERRQGNGGGPSLVPPDAFAPGNLAAVVETVERHLIATTLDRTRGNISESARVLGLTRRGLYLKMRRLGLEGAIADI